MVRSGFDFPAKPAGSRPGYVAPSRDAYGGGLGLRAMRRPIGRGQGVFPVNAAVVRSADRAWGGEVANAIVLAGGRSRRMGMNKAFLPFCGRPLIEHICVQIDPFFDEILICASEFLVVPGTTVVRDEILGQGPLRGIVSALAVSRRDLNFVLACDIPWIDLNLMHRLLQASSDCDGVVPITPEGFREPLFAVYRKSALSAMRRALEDGERRIVSAFRHCNVKSLPLAPGERIENMNTADDYKKLATLQETQRE